MFTKTAKHSAIVFGLIAVIASVICVLSECAKKNDYTPYAYAYVAEPVAIGTNSAGLAITSIEPSTCANGEDRTITIQGANFGNHTENNLVCIRA